MRMCSTAIRTFNTALEAVLPFSMVHKHLKRKGDTIYTGGNSYKLDNNVYVVGFGKAVSGMCRAVQDILGDHIKRGILSVPSGSVQALKDAGKSFLLPVEDGRTSIYEGAANNLPDESSFLTTVSMLNMLNGLTANNLVIVLISGGGSALLFSPIDNLSMREKLEITTALAKQGASITELNTVRKRLSKVKGGGLAKAAYPAQVVSLILSDIVGDPLEYIASGPTVNNTDTLHSCRGILEKYSVIHKVPESIANSLFRGDEELTPISLPNTHVKNIIVGSNAIAVDAAVQHLRDSDFRVFVLSKQITGEAKVVGQFFMELAILLSQFYGEPMEQENYKQNISGFLKSSGRKWGWAAGLHSSLDSFIGNDVKCSKLCFLGAGETTVTVNGQGKGGRNQEMVISAAVSLYQNTNRIPSSAKIEFLSAGTDGQDGPTDATGAVFDNQEMRIIKNDVDLFEAEHALLNNDSYNFLNKFPSNILKTGLTGTNVMDLQILTIEI